MATTYYMDTAGSNTSPYDTWAKAATSIQTVLDLAVAGDTIYCRGTQVMGATVDIDTQTGTNAAGWVKVVGCNAAGNVDGTRFYIDANGGSYNAVTFAAASDMYWFENIEVGNTGAGAYHGFASAATGSVGHVFINCAAHNCGGSGFRCDNMANTTCFRCVAYSCTATGFYSVLRNLFCCARDNGIHGFGYISYVYGCISHGNTDDGIVADHYTLLNSVIDGNGDDGVIINANTSLFGSFIVGNRITNQSGAGDIGLNCNSEPCAIGYNYLENNDGDNIQNQLTSGTIPLENSSNTSNLEDLSNTDYGYVDSANHDFSTDYTDSGDPDLRRTAITIPWS